MDKLEKVLSAAMGDELVGKLMKDEIVAVFPELADDKAKNKLANFIADVPEQDMSADETDRAWAIRKEQFAKVAYIAKMVGVNKQFNKINKERNQTEQTMSMDEQIRNKAVEIGLIDDNSNIETIRETLDLYKASLLELIKEQANETEKNGMQIQGKNDFPEYNNYYTDLDMITGDTYKLLSEFAERKYAEEKKAEKKILQSSDMDIGLTKEFTMATGTALQNAGIMMKNDAESTIFNIMQLEGMEGEYKEKLASNIVTNLVNTGNIKKLNECLYCIDIHRKMSSEVIKEFGAVASTPELSSDAAVARLCDSYPLMAAMVVSDAQIKGEKIKDVAHFEKLMDNPEIIESIDYLTDNVLNSGGNKKQVSNNESLFARVKDWMQKGKPVAYQNTREIG